MLFGNFTTETQRATEFTQRNTFFSNVVRRAVSINPTALSFTFDPIDGVDDSLDLGHVGGEKVIRVRFCER